MRIVDIAEPDDPNLRTFYRLYEKAFVLAEEREPLEGFQKLLSFNCQKTIQDEFGPLSEEIAIALDPAIGEAVGLINFILYAYPDSAPGPASFAGSCQLNFICVDENHRGKDIAGHLLAHLDYKMRRFIVTKAPNAGNKFFITCEQNNPSRMSAEQLQEDFEAGGIVPAARLKWWQKKGYRRLDFRYEQPPLYPGADPCTYLDYYARVSDESRSGIDSTASAILLEHLRRFFFVSVGKFAFDMSNNSQWLQQKRELESRSEIPLVLD